MTQDLANKTFIVTGANTGIGKVTAKELARRGAHVILACRSKAKSEPVVEEIKRETGNAQVELVLLDLGDLASVRACAEAVLARKLPIHGLINNAGLVARGTTKDGFELTFGTNHIGHYLFTRLLLDRLRETPGARIVNVSSHSHYQAKRLDWNAIERPTRTLVGLREYEQSKLANVLFTRELARHLEGSGVTTYAVHPGRVATDAWRRMPQPLRAVFIRAMRMLPPEEGARSTLIAATSPELASQTGRYYDAKGREKRPSRLAEDAQLATELWKRSAEWTGLPS
ncbi:MAG TPA: SDR family oxidoreductase [Kofleriaceae bacterium]|jgi:NAD(P)-dependent dehydrogenase (short-subunit alcohol dehydrogenase family)|nr:SDR family oxidoreductase [Kofleriaceae bacterium]